MPVRAGAGRLLAVMLLAAFLAGGARAQPYAADGGFSRPELQMTDRAASVVATVALAAAPGGPSATQVWADGSGVWSADLDAGAAGSAALLVASDAVRAVYAGYLSGDLAVAWVERNRRSGVFEHHVLWRGEQQLLFDDAVAVPLRLLEWEGRPWAAAALRREGEARLSLLPIGTPNPETEAVVLHRTELAVRGLDLLVVGSDLWLGWLEGKSERTEVGLVSEWSALVTRTRRTDATVTPSRVVDLGEADVSDERQAVALSAASDGASSTDGVWLLWPDADSQLRLSLLVPGDATPQEEFTSGPLGLGRAIGAAWPYAFWMTDSSVRRLDMRGLAGPLPAETTAEAQPLNVVWSPVTIEGAAFSHAKSAGNTENRYDAIAWYGRVQGGAVQIFHSDDSAPMRRNWRDRLAALMGWSPWHLVDEFIGQALTALLAGVLIAIAATPLLLVLSPLLARFFASPQSAVAAGLVIGSVPLLLASLLLALNLDYGAHGPVTAILEVVGAAAIGMITGWLASVRGDREAQGTVTLTGAMTVFAGFTVWSFLTYQNWAPIIGLA